MVEKSSRAMFSPIRSSISPPAMRNAGMEMPKNFRSPSPVRKKADMKAKVKSAT